MSNLEHAAEVLTELADSISDALGPPRDEAEARRWAVAEAQGALDVLSFLKRRMGAEAPPLLDDHIRAAAVELETAIAARDGA